MGLVWTRFWEMSNFTGLHGTGHGFHGICPNFTGLHGTGHGFHGICPNFTGLHGTGHGFHGVCPNCTGLVCTGSGFRKKNTGRDRDREHFHGISLDGNGIFDIPLDHGIFPYPLESQGIFTAGKIPRKALEISSRGPDIRRYADIRRS